MCDVQEVKLPLRSLVLFDQNTKTIRLWWLITKVPKTQVSFMFNLNSLQRYGLYLNANLCVQ